MAAPKRRVFVSHSAIGTPFEALLADLRRDLEDAGFSVFVSEHEGRVGVAFRNRILAELHDCSAAILLLSPKAMRSPWCITEISVAMARLWKDQAGFSVLPVLLGDATLTKLRKSGLGHLGLDDLLMAQPPTTATADIVAELEVRHPTPGPLHFLELTVANLLRGVDDELLGTAAACLGVQLTAWHPTGKRLAVAKAMLAVDPTLFTRALMLIRGVLRDHCAVIDLIFPFLWVEQQAVVPLTKAAESPGDRGAFSVNAHQARTGRWYVRRACTGPESWKVVDPVALEAEDFDASLLAEIRDQLVDQVKCDEQVDDRRLQAALDRFEESFGPIFVLLPDSVDDRSVQRCKARFPSVVFLVIAGDAVGSAALAEAELLTPLIADGREDAAHERYRQLVTIDS